jgi:hypothetical protein
MLYEGGCLKPCPGRFTPGKDMAPIVWGAGWAPGPVWTGAENLAPTRNRSPDRPARSESLYGLSCYGRRNPQCFWYWFTATVRDNEKCVRNAVTG